MSLTTIEGDGIFRDYNGSKDGKPVFETTNLDLWNKHCEKKGLTKSGSAACIICNKTFEFSKLPVGHNPVCGNCKGDLINNKNENDND